MRRRIKPLTRVKESKYLTEFKPEEYAPFYDTEYKFGKLILRVNTAHPFYQKVWQPLGDLAKNTVPNGETPKAARGPERKRRTRPAKPWSGCNCCSCRWPSPKPRC